MYLIRLLIFLFLVKWNFVGTGEKYLSLEIGDTVYIQEACDGKTASKQNHHWFCGGGSD